jgi:hypothetical protein
MMAPSHWVLERVVRVEDWRSIYNVVDWLDSYLDIGVYSGREYTTDIQGPSPIRWRPLGQHHEAWPFGY